MKFHLSFAPLPDGNEKSEFLIFNTRHVITRHVTDCDEKGPYFDIESYNLGTNAHLATNVTFGDSEKELEMTLNDIIRQQRKETYA